MTERIHAGDIVLVHVTENITVKGAVLSTPGEPGEAWVLQEEGTNKIVCVQTYCALWREEERR